MSTKLQTPPRSSKDTASGAKPSAAETLVALKERYHYDAETGVFTHLRGRKKGLPAGYPIHGYLLMRVGYRNFVAHRLAWLWVYGEWPVNILDHINRIRDDNRIANLRDVDHSTNCHNREAYGTRFKGVHRQYRLWVATIKVRGTRYLLGSFTDEVLAARAYDRKAIELLGENAVTNEDLGNYSRPVACAQGVAA